MDIAIDEIAAETFRLSSYSPEAGLTFNQFVVRDQQPLLYHTGFQRAFSSTRDAVATLRDPAKLRWIGFSHFEPDECGALNNWLAIAPDATAVTSAVGASVMLDDFADRPARALMDGERLDTGAHTFEFLSTPHLPHGWDASLLFDETERTLFASDLFLHQGEGPAVVETDIVGPAREMMASTRDSPFAHSIPWTSRTNAMFDRLMLLQPNTLAIMHGSAFRGNGSGALSELRGCLRTLSAS
ncbi:Putative diflavin flavoprotein A 3 [Aminobacter sp. MSH1]|uniref:MBL fold metallo-hydrolase n=1 Tax=Aminobacter sp. MSH1 TaxID=374606 RepID=UPI000D331FF9|nr:MBL fold metallo-hydrolase [Aminobacter sp. MSH1]AWC23961.1 Putative diflavin flavoprotein A 3 [Aminobacter sp. MSH1]